ncbi:MAG: helicase-related protein, partial [Myxococcota bacterium]|nr:helicase-related protein [Myxococcota bacterium]
MTADLALPVEAARPEFEDALDAGPVVFSAPTGAGKSTAVPRWLSDRGPVLVVEPRRVACRALGTRVAALEGTNPGSDVGWIVRDERRIGRTPRIVFVTPGVALRLLRTGDIERYATVVLDEFHERSLELDLLLALLLAQEARLVVMSATLAADRIAAHIGGRHIHAPGRIFEVERRFLPQGSRGPEGRELARRVRGAVEAAAELPGDILVFLPGKAEIRETRSALQTLDLDVLALHGGLRLEEQGRIFESGPRRRVVLATNVAETSLTVPRIGVVIDSGLVRRTRYRKGRGHLSLLPIAEDSAAQRAGRAGRLGPGVAIALWSPETRLSPRTPPEIHREGLAPLVLASAACGRPALDLPFLDPPRAHAVDTAREHLRLLGAIDPDHAITPRGMRLFGLPLDARLGRLLVEG